MKNALIGLSRKIGQLNTFLSIATGWVLVAMTSIVFYATILRYAFNRPPIWTTETSSFMFLFITFVPLGFVMQHDRHIFVDLLANRMNKKTRRVANICNAVMAAALFGFLAWQGVRLVTMAFSYDWLSPEMNIPLGYPYLLLPVGSVVMVVSCLSKAIEEVWPEDTVGK